MLQAYVQVFQMFQRYVASVSYGCCEVDRDVAYVAIPMHVCCKCLFKIFHLFFHKYVASVFIWMLRMFHTYVTSVLFGCCICLAMAFQVFSGFLQLFKTHVSHVSSVFKRTMQYFVWMFQK
jgi:hypothetical protein